MDMIEKCGSDGVTCEYSPGTVIEDYYGPRQELGRITNCRPDPITQEITVSQTTHGTLSLGLEVTLAAELSAPAAGSLSASITASLGYEWGWERTYSDTTTIPVEGYSWASYARGPLLRHITGDITVTLDEPEYGRRVWPIRDFDGVAEVPGSTGDTWVDGGPLTPEQCSGNPPSRTTEFHVDTTVSPR